MANGGRGARTSGAARDLSRDLGAFCRMIGIVRIALRRPYTFVVLALTILIIGPLAALRTPVDIFPDIRIPVIAVIWGYTGLPPDQMAGRIVTQSQRGLTTTVNDIEHIEATSYNGARHHQGVLPARTSTSASRMRRSPR